MPGTPLPYRPRRYSHLEGDTDAAPGLMQILNELAKRRGEKWRIASGRRTIQEQRDVPSLYGPKAPATPSAPHVRGIAADVWVNGKPLWQAVPGEQLRRVGLTTFPGGEKADPMHVELADTSPKSLLGKIGDVVDDALSKAPGPVGAAADAADAISGGASNAIDFAKDPVGAIIEGLSREGAKPLLVIALVVGGTSIAGLGLARMVGFRAPPLGAALTAAATRNPSALKAAA